jgi:short-subunit dehydrogenase involved in D-alanine esterification of teichoic acids
MNVGLQLTEKFSNNGLREIVSSRQAIVLQQLANTPAPKHDDNAKQT